MFRMGGWDMFLEKVIRRLKNENIKHHGKKIQGKHDGPEMGMSLAC